MQSSSHQHCLLAEFIRTAICDSEDWNTDPTETLPEVIHLHFIFELLLDLLDKLFQFRIGVRNAVGKSDFLAGFTEGPTKL